MNSMPSSNWPVDGSLLLQSLETERNRRLTEDRLKYYKPYSKQRDFHAAGATSRERLLMAGNQLGKTLAGGFEVAMHATGRYPDWWKGKRFDKPTVGWACGITGEVVRDTVQKVLVGRPGQEGTGEFIRLFGGAAALWTLGARGQQTAIPVVGFLTSLSQSYNERIAPAFLQGLSETGY